MNWHERKRQERKDMAIWMATRGSERVRPDPGPPLPEREPDPEDLAFNRGVRAACDALGYPMDDLRITPLMRPNRGGR
jgi:hypothetical protein